MKSRIKKSEINILKRSIAVILGLVIMLNITPIVSMDVSAYSIPSESDFLNKLNTLRSRYPNNGTYSGTYYENGEAKAWSCYGYACQMLYEVFGARFYADGFYAKKDYTMGTIYAGDFIRLDAGYGSDTHSIFVTKVTNDRVYFTDANYNNKNGIRWDASYSKSELARRFTYKVHIPGNTLTGNEHTHNWKYIYYLETHPHKNCYQCTECGEIKIDDNSSNFFEPCAECQRNRKVINNDETGIPDRALYNGILQAADENGDKILTVGEAEKIKELDIQRAGIADLRGIENCAALEKLHLDFNEIQNISLLSGVPKLTEVTLNYNKISGIQDINLPGLEVLQLCGNEITGINFSDMPKLKTLWLSKNKITDISALAKLSGVSDLELGENRITDVSALAGLSNLTTLVVMFNNISDVSPLSGLYNLEVLYLNHNEIKDIWPLANLSKLAILNLNENNVTDIGVAANLSKLWSLKLNGNEITDVSALSGSTNLTCLDIGNNRITDISSLNQLLLSRNLGLYVNQGNPIVNSGGIPEHVEYKEAVQIRYLSEKDKASIMELFGLTEYDGKVICLEREYGFDAVRKYSPYCLGYGSRYAASRDETGFLSLKRMEAETKKSVDCFRGSYDGLSVIFDNQNLWLVYRGNISASGLEFTDRIEKMTMIAPSAKTAENSDYNYDGSLLPMKKAEKLQKQNKEKNIVIQSNNNVSFVFEKNSMKAAAGTRDYDFTTVVTREYSSEELPHSVKESNFILKIDYSCLGQLPGTAIVRIPVGTEYVGKTVSYSLLNEDRTCRLLQRTVVDKDGYISVLQEHCFACIVTLSGNSQLGDVNGDGAIDAKDALAVLKHDVGIRQEIFAEEAADVNKDDTIDAKDALTILKHDVGLLQISKTE